MRHSILIFRYVELRKFGVEVRLNGPDIVLELRQPARPLLRTVLWSMPDCPQKRLENNLIPPFGSVVNPSVLD